MFNNFKKFFTSIILALIVALSFNGTSFAKVNSSEEIAPGVIREEHIVNYNKKNTYINLLKVDLNNPYVGIEVVAGNGKYTQRATVSQMAKRTDATALVNGDFFNTLLQGSPEGPSIVGGKLQTSPVYYNGLYSLGITKDNVASIEQISFTGNVKAKNGKTFKLDSLNKSYYWYEDTNEYSHQDKLNLYNDFWASKSRGEKTNSEILVNANGVVEQISEGKNFNFPVPDGKLILQADGKAYDFIKQNVKIGDQIAINYSISPKKDFKFLIGGHALLVNNGQVVKYTKDINVLGGVRARTCAGISKDGKTLYIASAEGRTKRSAGMSLPNLSDFMVSIGANKALNLDGGGSTAMVAKNLGDFERTRFINPERNAGERKVVNGIGIYNTAPSTNNVAGLKINGPDSMLVGTSAEFSVKGAWNENLKPIKADSFAYSLSSASEEKGLLNGKWYLALAEGENEIKFVTQSGYEQVKKVNVYGFDKVKDLKIKLNNTKMVEGGSYQATVKAVLNDKTEKDIDPRVLSFELEGFSGSVDGGGNFTIDSLNGLSKGLLKVKAGNLVKTIDLYDKDSMNLVMTIDKKNYTINGVDKKMDTSPFIKDSRTFVPIRFVMDALNAEINYNESNREVEISYNDQKMIIPIDKKYIMVNDEKKNIDTAAFIKDSRTFVPIRFVSESLGLSVDYNDSARQVIISGN